MTTADFETIVELVAAGLKDGGFAVARVEDQKWAAHFSLERANIDGTVSLSFGPIFNQSDLQYHIVHEKTFDGEIKATADTTPTALANQFLNRLTAIMNNSLGREGFSDPHAGVGLIDPA